MRSSSVGIGKPEVRCVPQGNGTWRCEYLNWIREDVGLAMIVVLILFVLIVLWLELKRR
jgi:hypothetical protein